MGTGSLHASVIAGGRELSSYPDRCVLKLERRTVSGETDAEVTREIEAILEELRGADPEFEATLTPLFGRPSYQVAPDHALPRALRQAAAAHGAPAGPDGDFVGMSFWTDAAVLGSAGIPSVLFGPGGAGLHSTEEYVEIAGRPALPRRPGRAGARLVRIAVEGASPLLTRSCGRRAGAAPARDGARHPHSAGAVRAR